MNGAAKIVAFPQITAA